jgi:hypothetical protein
METSEQEEQHPGIKNYERNVNAEYKNKRINSTIKTSETKEESAVKGLKGFILSPWL